jgi:hypothetical protein
MRRPEFKYKLTLGGMFGLRTWDNWQLTAAQRAFLLATKEEEATPDKPKKKNKAPVKRFTREQMEEIKRRAKQEATHGITAA